MAPKGGKGGGHSSSSGGSSDTSGSSCGACTSPLELVGSNWKDGKILALFALDIIAIGVILLCFIVSFKFTLTKDGGARDRLRNMGYKFAAFLSIISYSIAVVDTSLRETDTTVVYLYYILFIFNSFIWRIAELLLLGLVIRLNTESTIPGLWKRMHPLHALLILIVGLASGAAFGLYTAQTVSVIRGGVYRSFDYARSSGYANVAYFAIYFLIGCLAALEAVVVLLKERSKTALITCALITPAFFIRNLVQLINAAINITTTANYSALWDMQWASAFTEAVMTPAVFAGIVLVGLLTARKSRAMAINNKPTEYKGTAYAPVNTYG